jgi:Protein of unknown function (DUF1353)
VESLVSRRALLIGATATAVECHISPTLALADEKVEFVKAAIAEINSAIAAMEAGILKREKLGRGRKRKKHAFILPLSEVVPFGDWDYWYLDGRPLNWEPNAGQKTLPKVSVPIGFVSDGASIPRLFWSALPKIGRYMYAAIVHDYLYWTQNTTRQTADTILKTAMSDSGVDPNTVGAISGAVRAGGQSAWDENKKLKQAGEKRPA